MQTKMSIKKRMTSASMLMERAPYCLSRRLVIVIGLVGLAFLIRF